jgi:putative ABC transport system substrate-binding protein
LLEERWGGGKPDRLAGLAEELVRLKVDVIVASTTPGILAAKKATTTIPIVMGGSADPVGTGLVASLARPGGNITGLSMLAPDLDGKRVELLKEVVPKLSRVTMILDPANRGMLLRVKEAEAAAEGWGVKLQRLEVQEPYDFEKALSELTKERAGSLLVAGLFVTYRRQIVELAAKNRIPAHYDTGEFVEAGGLLSYGPSIADLHRRAATYVDKILKGTKPAELPVEQPMKFDFIVNLKSAKQIGLTIPPNVLVRADRVVR